MILSIDFRTDIPAFYSDWILNRFKEGYLMFRNPVYPSKVHKVILDNDHVEGIMWCSKNYAPILPRLSEITDKFPSVFHYTITGYGKEIEPNVPELKDTINCFRQMSEIYGKEKVIWRYDPIFFNSKEDILMREVMFGSICEDLKDYTDRVVINFLTLYEKVKRHMPDLVTMSYDDKLHVVQQFLKIANFNGLKLQTCGNGLQFKDLEGVEVTGCLDTHALSLMGINTKFNRKEAKWGCLCFPNTSVGEYNTCLHKCKYCYASADFDKCDENYKKHNPNSPLLIGDLKPNDTIEEMKPKLLGTDQLTLNF
jgi:hypothetical protein